MKTGLLKIWGLAVFLAAPMAFAQAADPVPTYGPVQASEVTLDDLKWVARPVVVFGDSDNDPNVERQLRLLLERPELLIERDIVILVDTNPAAKTAPRITLRPRGFSLVILDRDSEVKLRKPTPWSAREIIAAIDKFPSRRQEMLEQYSSGR